MTQQKEYASQLRNQSLEELKSQYDDLKKELYVMRNMSNVEKKVEQPHLFQEIKRKIAQILTIMAEKKKNEEVQHVN
jgi:ribosomal protein L29